MGDVPLSQSRLRRPKFARRWQDPQRGGVAPRPPLGRRAGVGVTQARRSSAGRRVPPIRCPATAREAGAYPHDPLGQALLRVTSHHRIGIVPPSRSVNQGNRPIAASIRPRYRPTDGAASLRRRICPLSQGSTFARRRALQVARAGPQDPVMPVIAAVKNTLPCQSRIDAPSCPPSRQAQHSPPRQACRGETRPLAVTAVL